MTNTAILHELNIQPEIIARLKPADKEAVDAAISDVLVSNSFFVKTETNAPSGPFTLNLTDKDGRLDFEVLDDSKLPCARLIISLAPFRRHIRDYLMICDSYYTAIREGAPHQIEAMDMARRGIHDEAASLLTERLHSKIHVDFDTARRLFTLLSVMKMVG